MWRWSNNLILFLLVANQIPLMTASEYSSGRTSLGSKLKQRWPSIRAVLSDIDGTLVHYPDEVLDEGLIRLPPSSTGMKGVISQNTIDLCQRIRRTKVELENNDGGDKRHVILVLVSGMRTNTLLQRLSSLPFADAYCSENGGRIFYPEPLQTLDKDNSFKEGDYDQHGCYIFRPAQTTLTEEEDYIAATYETATEHKSSHVFRLVEDIEWRKRQDSETSSTNDPIGHQGNQRSQTTPLLHEFASRLKSLGWVLDEKGYTTCFRIHQKHQISPLFTVLDLPSLLPDGLMISTNLGCVDVYPRTSGKKNACQYLIQEKFKGVGTLSDNCIFLCDDDNDIELAISCCFAFLPTISSESMKSIVQSHSERIIVANGMKEVGNLGGTTLATDALLQNIIQRFFTDSSDKTIAMGTATIL